MTTATVDAAFREILRGKDTGWPLGMYVEAVFDIERPRGYWVRVSAILADPDPEVGLPRPVVKSIQAVGRAGEIVQLTTAEVNALGDRFERVFYQWRDRGIRKG